MGILDEALAYLDAKKRLVARNIGDLASNPADVLNQWGSQVKEDTKSLGQVARGVSSTDPEVQRAAVAGMLPLGMLGMTAYHGSPHTFDKFDMSKIGTGEGAQAYGHGLYFAENPEVAKTYANTLGELQVNTPQGVVRKTYSGGPQDTAHSYVQFAMGLESQNPLATALEQATKNGESPLVLKTLQDWQKANAKVETTGKVYNVDIPDEHVAKMLDWDAPLAQQPDAVRQFANAHWGDPSPKLTGQDIYHALGYTGPKRLAEEWAKLGVPGVRYLDGTSRVGGEGTRNMVLFDDSIPKITGVQ